MDEGICSVRYVKGSNFTERFAQVGHTSVDLYSPWANPHTPGVRR